jgi:transcriptional regulator with XRE-family HTH domain
MEGAAILAHVPVADPRKPLGQIIRIRRETLGLMQEQLAGKAALHWTFISRIERGIRNISLVNPHSVAESLGVRLRDLVDKC